MKHIKYIERISYTLINKTNVFDCEANIVQNGKTNIRCGVLISATQKNIVL